MGNVYYVYRHSSALTGKPFYIGMSKTKGYNRAYIKAPSVRSKDWYEVYKKEGVCIEILAKHLTKELSGELEEFLIELYGRRDLGTGILVNKSNGGIINKGMVRTEENKQLLSKGRKDKFKGCLNPYYGKKHSNETKEKMRGKRPYCKGSNNGKAKKVLNTITGTVYESAVEASEKEDIGYSSLRSYLNGTIKNKTSLIYLE